MHYSVGSRRGEWLGPRNPSAGEALLQKLRSHEGDFGFTISCDEAGSDRGYRPK